MTDLKVVNVKNCDKWVGDAGDICVTLERPDGKRFSVNIPDDRWTNEADPLPHGLNLVFGEGCHYQ